MSFYSRGIGRMTRPCDLEGSVFDGSYGQGRGKASKEETTSAQNEKANARPVGFLTLLEGVAIFFR
jgi:hypothetical protein